MSTGSLTMKHSKSNWPNTGCKCWRKTELSATWKFPVGPRYEVKISHYNWSKCLIFQRHVKGIMGILRKPTLNLHLNRSSIWITVLLVYYSLLLYWQKAEFEWKHLLNIKSPCPSGIKKKTRNRFRGTRGKEKRGRERGGDSQLRLANRRLRQWWQKPAWSKAAKKMD